MMNEEFKQDGGGALTLQSLSCFISHVCGVTHLKMAHLVDGGELYTVRTNPSSGGLHPTEFYLVLPPGLVADDSAALLVHYQHLNHTLQIRAKIDSHQWKQLDLAGHNHVIVCGTYLYWREVWKYGVRGFRYSLLDAGHAIAASAVAAKTMMWNTKILNVSTATLGSLLGLNRTDDFPSKETQDPQFALVVGLTKPPNHIDDNLALLASHASKFTWSGPATKVNQHHHDKAVQQVASAASSTTFELGPKRETAIFACTTPIDPISSSVLASATITNRRSAHNFMKFRFQEGYISQSSFYRLLKRTVPSPHCCQIWHSVTATNKMDAVWLVLYVHRVEGLKQGVYVLFRDNLAPQEATIRAQNFQNAIYIPEVHCEKTAIEKPPGCPSDLHLFQLLSGDFREFASSISVSQSLCANGAFLASMMADIPNEIATHGASQYRTLHFEAGIIGHLLYLEATAIGKGATGVGAYCDEAANSIFHGNAKTLYHFVVGQPTKDLRISLPVDKMKNRTEISELLSQMKQQQTPPSELLKFPTLYPVPYSSRATNQIPYEYFEFLRATQPNLPTEVRREMAGKLFDKAYDFTYEFEPVPGAKEGHLTPREKLDMYLKRYKVITLLSEASTLWVDTWEYYADRGLAFKKMHEHDLAWQDHMRCIHVIETALKMNIPLHPNALKLLPAATIFRDQLAIELGMKTSVLGITEFREVYESQQPTVAKRSLEQLWVLGIGPNNTRKFLDILDRIPLIKQDANGTKREWHKFPTIMKNNYTNFTSHPTNATDPRNVAWNNTMKWLEDKHLTQKPLTMEFLVELNKRCMANDAESEKIETNIWGREAGFARRQAPVGGFRTFESWLRNEYSNSNEEMMKTIAEKFKLQSVTVSSFHSVFSPEQQQLIEKHYNLLTSPKQIQTEMHKLIELANSASIRNQHPVQRAAILGVRLVAIHPFESANGRTQQLLMSLELMREGYPPITRRDLYNFYRKLQASIRTLEKDPNCEVFTQWCAVEVALAMIGADVSNSQLRAYAEKLFVEKMVFEPRWSNGNFSLAPVATLSTSNSAKVTSPTTCYQEYWMHAHNIQYNETIGVGSPDSLLVRGLQTLTIEDINNTATEHSILSGKWVIEVSEGLIDRVWSCIAQAVSSGMLKRTPSAKTSTALGFMVPPHFHSHYVVCVYTSNYMDKEDVMQAGAALYSVLAIAGLESTVGSLRYKPDIYTHSGIYAGTNKRVNEWLYTFELGL